MKEAVLARGWLKETILDIDIEVISYLNNDWHCREFCYWASDTLTGRRILDVGCGHGFVSFFLKKRGYDVTAAEYGEFPSIAFQLGMERNELDIPFIKKFITYEDLAPFDVILAGQIFWTDEEAENNADMLRIAAADGKRVAFVSERVQWGTHPTLSQKDFNVKSTFMSPTGLIVWEL